MRLHSAVTLASYEPSLPSRLYLILCLLSAAGCGPTFENRTPDFSLVPARLIIMPVLTRSVELDFEGHRSAKRDWAHTMGGYAGAEVQKWAKEKGAAFLPVEKLEDCQAGCEELLASFLRWGANAAMEIAAQKSGRHDFGFETVGEWTAARDYHPLQKALNADFALIVVLKDTRETTGHALGNALSGRYTFYKQVAVACVASLGYVQMKWCHSEIDKWVDLRQEGTARAAIRKLLSDL